ncbi:MAG: lamin tail domain-containing protein, partial [Methanothrix sp.]|nr:lamin tail domain-containing protein [Methanothrix sp.]
MASSCISFISVGIILRRLLSNFKLNSHAYMLKISDVIALLILLFLFFATISGSVASLTVNSIAPTSVNVCDSNGFVVYVNNTGTTPEKDILLNVTIPQGFSYDGYSGIYFPGGDSNDGPTNESGKHLEWNLTEIMTPEMGVVINELLPNPAGTDSGNERIELYNAGTSTVNVKEWYLRDICHWRSKSVQLRRN